MGNLTVGEHPNVIGINERTNRIFVANYDSNTVSVIDGGTNRVVATIGVRDKPRALADNRLYIANSDPNRVDVIDYFTTKTDRSFKDVLIANITSVGNFPNSLDFNSNT